MPKENECVGSYEVSGYTRQDGTEVSGYTRRCGAAHASKEESIYSDTRYDEKIEENYPTMGTVIEGGVEYDDYQVLEGGGFDWVSFIKQLIEVVEAVMEGIATVKNLAELRKSINDIPVRNRTEEIKANVNKRLIPEVEIGLQSLKQPIQAKGEGKNNPQLSSANIQGLGLQRQNNKQSSNKMDSEKLGKRPEPNYEERASILYGSDEDYIKKYYGKEKETDIIKRYEEKELENLKRNIQEKVTEKELIKSNNFKFSDSELQRARKFIQGEEGFRSEAYKPTPNDVWTIGYGHTGLVDGKPIKEGMRITKEKAEELYRKDFESHIKPLKEIEVPLTSNQKIALASLIYNIGVGAFLNSDIRKKLDIRDYEGAANEFERWVYHKGKILNGLVNRRNAEKKLFLTPDIN